MTGQSIAGTFAAALGLLAPAYANSRADWPDYAWQSITYAHCPDGVGNFWTLWAAAKRATRPIRRG